MSEKCEDCASIILKAGLTPVDHTQRPGLDRLSYRAGTHGRFKEAMKAGIAGQPALKALATRDDNDPSIALLDACATMLDVLTFYQERIANEGYLRTATERLSVGALADQIGYQLGPGVAASVPLAFTVEDAKGAPGFATIDPGTKVQSIPGPGEKPQTFETIEALTAYAQFNCLKPKTTGAQEIGLDMTRLYLKGTNLQLKPGDALLIVGEERKGYRLSENWDVRLLQTVATDKETDTTIVTWLEPLGKRKADRIIYPSQDHPKVFVMRQRAALFGHNAPDPLLLDVDSTRISGTDWAGFQINQAARTLDLDGAYPKILKNGWLVLAKPGTSQDIYTEAYLVERVSLTSRKDYALSSDVTRILVDTTNNLDEFGLRETVVYAQSEELELAEIPFRTPEKAGSPSVRLGEGMLTPVDGAQITLSGYVPDLQKGQLLVVSGKRARLKSLFAGIFGIFNQQELAAGSIVQVVGTPVFNAGLFKFFVKNPTHFVDAIEVDLSGQNQLSGGDLIEYVPAKEDDDLVSEAVTIESIGEADNRTVIYLSEALKNVYDRKTVSIYGNCARATHGETKSEILGSGNAGAAFQKFVLAQTPLTYVSAATSGGSESTLAVRVNDILWKEVPSLYGQDGRAQVYTTRIADDGKVTVQFGDGLTGARLPSGTENVKASYRVGTGLEGMVKAGQISLLMSRPLGLKSAVNPGAPEGASDPETRDEARVNAPYTVLTFDRIVSLKDYEDFARSFAGIGKTSARWLWNGHTRFVHLTVAAAGGAEIQEDSVLLTNLKTAIKTCGLPRQHFMAQSYTPLTFSLKVNVQIREGYLEDKVTAAVRSALSDTFSFEKRLFGQDVAASEVLALIQGIDGVEMADLDYLKVKNTVALNLAARTARWESQTGTIYPAELLVVDPQGIELIVLTEKAS